jgi:hypothetical protein
MGLLGRTTWTAHLISAPDQKRKDSNPPLKSEVAIASLFCQIQLTKKNLLQVKTITKSAGNGIAESVKSSNLH